MSALPIRVTFLSPVGEALGWKMLTPSGGNWRALNRLPRVQVFRRDYSPFPFRDCVRHGDGWAVWLRPEDPMPLKMNAVEAVTNAANP